MHIAKTLSLSLVLAGLATPALAIDQGEKYIGGGLSLITYDEDGFEEATPTALVGRLGYGIVDNIAIEGRFGFGLTDDSVNVLGTDVDVDVDQVAGVYGIGHLPIADRFSLYGLAGFTYGEVSASALGLSVEGDETDFSYGFGGEFDLSEKLSGFVEWVRYFDDSNYKVSGITSGVNYRF